MVRMDIKTNVVMWNNSGGKCARFSEEHPKCERVYKTIYKIIRLLANTGELDCVWPKMLREKFFMLIFETVKKNFRNLS